MPVKSPDVVYVVDKIVGCSGRLVVAVTNKFGWVQDTVPMKPGDPVNDKPEPARGVRITGGRRDLSLIRVPSRP